MRDKETDDEGSAWLKFEIVEPAEGIGDDAAPGLAHPTPRDERFKDPESFETGEGRRGTEPIGQRMAKAVLGVRASLDLLRVHVVERDMAEVYRAPADRTEVDSEAVFHPHRFSASSQEETR